MSKLVVFMEMRAIDSGEGRVYLEIDNSISPNGVGNSTSITRKIHEDPRVQEYTKAGYAGPLLITSFDENLENELAEVQHDVDVGGWMPWHQNVIDRKLKEFIVAKRLYAAGVVEV